MGRAALVFGFAVFFAGNAVAQQDTASRSSPIRSHTRAWIVPIGVVASTAVDPELREWALRTHSRSLDRLARVINPLGTGRVLIPGLAAFYAGSLLTGAKPMQHVALETVAAYIVSDAAESILKPIVGRQRPYAAGNSHSFRPFNSSGDWHSFPSAHIAHIASIAEVISMKSDSRVLSLVCDALVAAVGWDRIYEDQHWASDVTATAALTTLISSATVRWVRSRWSDH